MMNCNASLEMRDQYFSKLKSTIELNLRVTDQKSVLVCHSMGSLVAIYFMKWVELDVTLGGGGGGDRWCETHIESFVNIAGTLFGVPKAMSSFISGEMKGELVLFAGSVAYGSFAGPGAYV
jgi:phospholipid:diacylglycerol acyltransferase